MSSFFLVVLCFCSGLCKHHVVVTVIGLSFGWDEEIVKDGSTGRRGERLILKSQMAWNLATQFECRLVAMSTLCVRPNNSNQQLQFWCV
jgi:hypothetical protein